MTDKDPFSAELGNFGDDLKASLGFLTRVPASILGIATDKSPDFRRAARVFPIVGALIGILGAVVLAIVTSLGVPLIVGVALTIGVTIAVTGGLHEDGLADTADSLGGTTAEQKLEIMDDSRIGTYGASALIISILIRVGALTSIAAIAGYFRAGLVLIAAEAVSRAAIVRLWHELPAARMGGLAHETGPPDGQAMWIAIAAAVVIVAITVIPAIGFWAAIVGLLLAAVGTYIFTRLTARAIGGRTGDTLGGCQQVALAAFLVGVSAF